MTNSEHIPNGQVSDERLLEYIEELRLILRGGWTPDTEAALQAGIDALDALTRRSSAGVKVTALEWDVNRGFAAHTPFGLYETEPHGEVWHLLHCGCHLSTHPTEDEAKAAAQADFNTRILSALSSPAHIGEDEPVAWRHKLTGIVRTDKPAVGMGLHEDYDALYLRPSPSVQPQGATSDQVRTVAVGDIGWARVRVDTSPVDGDGWCFCTPSNHPEDIAWGRVNGDWNEASQFFGQVALTPSPTLEPTDAEVERAIEAYVDALKDISARLAFSDLHTHDRIAMRAALRAARQS